MFPNRHAAAPAESVLAWKTNAHPTNTGAMLPPHGALSTRLRAAPTVWGSLETLFPKLQSSVHVFWRRQWHPTPVLSPGKSHGWRNLVGCGPWRRKESDTTERIHFHFSLSCIGEGNSNPLQCSCLENPRDRGAWWSAIYGVTQSQTRLKRLSSSSSSRSACICLRCQSMVVLEFLTLLSTNPPTNS